MTETTLECFSENPESFVRGAQQERVLVTQDGRPVAMLVGLENKDQEDWQLELSAEFWSMMEQHRQRPMKPLADVEAALFEQETE